MKRTTGIAIAVATALALGAAVAEVSAHPGGTGWGMGFGGGYGMHGGMGPGMHGGMGPGMHGGMGPGMHGGGYGMHGGAWNHGYPGAGKAGTEEGLAGLKAELAITADQEGAWNAFENSVKRQEESRQAWFARMHETRESGSLPERQARRDELLDQQRAERKAATAALKDLYAALTPQQKAIAERSLAGFGPGHMAGHGPGRFGGRNGQFQ